MVRPLNYVPYIKQDAIELLVEKFGWQPYPQKHFESRFTRFYEGYWLPKKFGYDTRLVQFSSLILTGQMTREEALKKLVSPPYDEATITGTLKYVATKLGISVAELQGFMDAPNKSYKDYRSQDWIYTLGAKAMKALGLESGRQAVITLVNYGLGNVQAFVNIYKRLNIPVAVGERPTGWLWRKSSSCRG